jgi:phosphotriesterase-related protein
MTTVETVLGEVPTSSLGRVLMHEHVFCDTSLEYRGDGLLHDVRLATEELAPLASEPTTVVDLSTQEIGRRPKDLREVSRATGVHIVMGCGHYRDPYLDRATFDRSSVPELTERLVREIEEGVDGVRPGIIGEIGADRGFVSAAEERSLRAAARAQARTGLTISTHSARWPVARAQLEILREEGADPTRVVVGHLDTVPDPALHLEVAQAGSFVELDSVGTTSAYQDGRIVEYVLALVRAGHLDRVLLSQDVFLGSHLRAHGGHGYGHLFSSFVPRLVRAGLDPAEVDRILVDNPARALARA